MSRGPQVGEPTPKRIETAVKLIVLVGPGFLILMFGYLTLMNDFSYGEPFVDPRLDLVLIIVGAVMILAGTGRRGRWAYLWVFLSIPIVGLFCTGLSSFLPETQPDLPRKAPRLFGMVVFAAPLAVSYLLVKRS
jgi:hypothetical protein